MLGFISIISFHLTNPQEVGIIIIPILQTKKWRFIGESCNFSKVNVALGGRAGI